MVHLIQHFTIGRVQEGMRELDVLKDKRDVNLASTMTLMLGHKYSQTVGMYDTKTTFTVFKTEKI